MHSCTCAVTRICWRGEPIAAAVEVRRGYEPAPTLLAHERHVHDAILVVTSPRSAGEPSHWFNTVRRLIHSSARPVIVVPADRPGCRGRP